MGDTPVANVYGVLEQSEAPDALSAHVDRIRVAGYTVVESGFTSGQVADFAERLDAVIARQLEESGEAAIAAVGDAGTARCLLAYDEAFVHLAASPVVLELCRRLLGEYFILLQQNGLLNLRQGQPAHRAFHRDLPYQHFVSSRPIAISALFCIEPFRRDNGGTVVIPASHRFEAFPSDSAVGALATTIEAPAGSFLVFDAMIFHRAGVNTSDRPRRAVNHVYGLPFVAQQISLPDALAGSFRNDPALARLLGYRSAPAPSVQAWRERQLAKAARR